MSVYNYRQRFADLRWAGFLPLNFMRSTKLSATTKLSAEHETPPIANVLLAVRCSFLSTKFSRLLFATALVPTTVLTVVPTVGVFVTGDWLTESL